MGESIEGLARFAATAQWMDVSDAVRRHTKLVLLDTLGVILAGADRPEVKELRGRMKGKDAAGATVFARDRSRCDAATAALLNGIAGRSIELCEGMRFVSAQPAVQVLPGVLAVGEMVGSSGLEFLSAFAVGYEVSARLCTAFSPRPLAHPNGQATLIGAVAAGARIRGLDQAGISLSMRIASTLLLTPRYTGGPAGATTLNVAGGMSGYASVLAPLLAVSGFDAEPDAVEASLGEMVGIGFQTNGILDDLGERWGIASNYFRLHACCSPIHPALDSLQSVLVSLKPRSEEIERVDVSTYKFASVMRETDPANFFASKYSLPHAAATMIVRGGAGFSELDDDALSDPAIASLRRRVNVSEDPAMSALAPRLKSARVTVILKDGREATHECDSARGGIDKPFAELEVRTKFRQLAKRVLSCSRAAMVEDAIDHAEDWRSVGELVELCCCDDDVDGLRGQLV